MFISTMRVNIRHSFLLINLLIAFGESSEDVFQEHSLQHFSVDAIADHVQMLEDLSLGSRSVGTSSYDASVQYIQAMLENAGYTNVTKQDFTFLEFRHEGNSTLSAPDNDQNYIFYEDYAVMTHSGSGAVTAVGEAIPNLGCESADFANFTSGNIAIISRGECTFSTKAINAREAGAVGILIFQPLDRMEEGIISGYLGDDVEPFSLPCFFTTFNASQELVGTQVSMLANVSKTWSTSFNVIAETDGNDDAQVVMAGAHLDSVPEGPGINDNGSGSATLLEIAIQMASVTTFNKVRFAWWGAEEIGLKGSKAYVRQLTEMEARKIALYLNMDMIGSPNWGRFVMDDQTVAGEENITAVFQEYFAYKELTTEAMEPLGGCRSDHCFFQKAGIPAGGLFTGAEGNKTDDQAIKFGGEAGTAYDPCYHQACDSLANVDFAVLEQNANAYVHTILTFANMEEIHFPQPESNEDNHIFSSQNKAQASEYEGDYLIK